MRIFDSHSEGEGPKLAEPLQDTRLRDGCRSAMFMQLCPETEWGEALEFKVHLCSSKGISQM